MNTNFLRLPEVIKRTGLSRSTIYKSINENQFPESIRLGPKSVAWVDSDIQEWQDGKIKQSNINKTQED